MTMTDTRVVKTRTSLRELSLFEYQGELFYGAHEDRLGPRVVLERTFDGTLLQEPIDLIWITSKFRGDRITEGWYPSSVKFENGDAIVHHGLNSVYVTSTGNRKRLEHHFALSLIESNDGDGELLKNFQRGV